MSNTVILKSTRFLKQILFNFNNDIRYFSAQLAFARLFETLSSRIPIKTNNKLFFAKWKNKIITAYLADNYSEVITKYKSVEELESKWDYYEHNTIWIFWWQGRDYMPAIVKKCVDSIYQHNSHINIIMITQNNCSEYVKVPDYILGKLNSGKMKTAHFSDYVRSFLIANYGGLWMDATLFCTQPVPKEVFAEPLYSGKSQSTESEYIAGYRWTTFILAGKKNNILFHYLCDFFLSYWKNEEIAIDYLFFDNIIDLAYDNISLIKKQIDAIPVNTVHRDNLAAAFYKKYTPESYNEIFMEDTWFYKISWRENFPLVTGSKEKTNFYHFMNS